MEENSRPLPPHIGHETGDVDAWAVGKFGVGLVLICIVSMAALLGLFKFFASQHDPLAHVDPSTVFPEPRLQVTPMPDLKAVRDNEDNLLHSYAWVDPKHGLVRIPIDQAIDILAAKGLPSRPQAAAVEGKTK